MARLAKTQRGKYRGVKTHLYELRLSRGPIQIGQVSDDYNQMLGAVYALSLDTDGVWRLERYSGVAWESVSDPVLSILPPAAKHIALCFDQAARPVVAYEQDESVYITQFDAFSRAYVVRGPFDGVGPVLIWDYEASHYAGDSDVLLLYLSRSRLEILMRAQRDEYSIQYLVHNNPTSLFLDQCMATQFRLQLIAGQDSDQPTPISIPFITELYPYRTSVRFGIQSQFIDGEYRET